MYNATGLEKGIRHPAVYLMEAADDITYIGDDIEDGVKKGYIDIDTEYERLKKRYKSQQKNFFISCDNYFEQINEKMSKSDQLNAKARYFRNTIQGYLINKAKEEFLNNYECIMSGDYGNVALLERDSNMKSFIGELKGITGRNCFGCREVLALELVGHKVITGLLDILVPAVLRKDCNYEDTKQYEGKIANIISSNYIYIAKQDYNYESKDDPMDEKTRKLEELSDYEKIHLVVDFVSGMTDSYAMNLYQELMGIKLPYQ
jgi:dGTPase